MANDPTPAPGSERQPAPGVTVVGPADPAAKVSVTLRLRAAAPMPEAPDVTLTHEQYEAAHGATPDDVAKVKAFAADHGLDVQEVSEARRTVRLSGTVAQMQTAFGSELKQATHPDGGVFRTRVGALTVPGHLDGVIEAVMGLDDRPQAQPHFRRHKPGSVIQSHASGGFTPVQVCAAYNFPKVSLTRHQKIAVISLGGGFVPADIAAYFQGLGLPAPTVTVVPVDGGANTPGSDADVENDLDIEASGGVYSTMTGLPAQIYFMAAPNTDAGFLDAITTAIHTVQVDVITISWGSAEANWSAQAMQQFDQAFQAAGVLGISVFAASGDNGSSDGGSGNNVDFPASSPNCTGCGGTRLAPPNETVWGGANDGGSGGGFSTVFAKPAYQASVPGSSRGVPDASGVADPNTPWITSDGTVGGTSAVAPMYAGATAGMSSSLPKNIGAFNALAYPNAGAFKDITSGNNGGFTAAVGWDPCTGLGSPNGAKLLAAAGGAGTAPPVNPPPVNPPPIGLPPPPPPVAGLTLKQAQASVARHIAALHGFMGQWVTEQQAATAAVIGLASDWPKGGSLQHASVFAAVAHGVPWATILQWIETYGLSAVLQVLPVILSGGAANLTAAQIITWVLAALAAFKAGGALPPLPVV